MDCIVCLRTECGVKDPSKHVNGIARSILYSGVWMVRSVWYVIDTSVYVSTSAHNFIGLVLVWNKFHNVSLTKFSS